MRQYNPSANIASVTPIRPVEAWDKKIGNALKALPKSFVGDSGVKWLRYFHRSLMTFDKARLASRFLMQPLPISSRWLCRLAVQRC